MVNNEFTELMSLFTYNLRSFKDLTMSRASHNDSNSESEEEDIDGLIASVLQDIEIKDSMNEGPEGSNVTAHTKPTNTKPTNTNNNSKDSNENIDMDTIPPIPSNTPNSIYPQNLLSYRNYIHFLILYHRHYAPYKILVQ